MKEKKLTTFITIVLVMIIVLLGAYIGYDKILNKDKCVTTEKELEKGNEQTEEKEDEKLNCVQQATRTCNGIYSGEGVVLENIATGEQTLGIITIELKEDGTYDFKKECEKNICGGASGSYTIIENALLLKTKPDLCKPNMDCSEQYSLYFTISDDCSTISNGYGSYFFNPNFTLNKIN